MTYEDKPTDFNIVRRGPYYIFRPQYNSKYPSVDKDNEFIIIKGPYELNAIIKLLSDELKRNYPDWKIKYNE